MLLKMYIRTSPPLRSYVIGTACALNYNSAAVGVVMALLTPAWHSCKQDDIIPGQMTEINKVL